ncbi:MAG: hypothetical protein WC209_03900 [Ignavibacteriaceae bacterium]
MVRLIRFVLFLFYKYYSVGPNAEISFFAAITSFLAIIMLNVIIFWGIFGVGIDQVIPLKQTDEIWKKYLEIAIYFALPAFTIMYLFFKQERIKNLKYDSTTIELGNLALVFYIVALFIAIIVVGIIKGGQQ